MIKQKADEIFKEIRDEWIKKYGKNNIDPDKLKAVKELLYSSPHDDGLLPVKTIDVPGTRLVPIKDIILYGLHGKDVEKYPLAKGDSDE